MSRAFLLTLTIPFFALMLHGCNTMEGAGRDVQAVGSKIENSAERNKR